MISLSKALRLSETPRVALVGAGGKTTALFRLARELPGPVLVTTTTHLSLEQLKLADRSFEVQGAEDIPNSISSLVAGINLFTSARSSSGRTAGVDPASLDKLKSLADTHHLPLLIEADGSRMLPLKAPAEHEPPIPTFVDTVVVVAGLSGLGKLLTEETVYRMERFGELAGIRAGGTITTSVLQKVLLHPQGGLKNIPPGAKRVVLLNQADSENQLHDAIDMAGKPYTNRPGLLASYDAVIISHEAQPLAVYEHIAGIVLAAGGSRRWKKQGKPSPKQVAVINGEPLVRRVARSALEAGLNPVILVTGSDAVQVQNAVRGLPVAVIHCDRWQDGMSASLKTGLSQVPNSAGAAVFLLADQPFLPVDVLHELVMAHARTFSMIAAPRVKGKRANPVLFDRTLFGELMKVTGDEGGRSLFKQVPEDEIAWVDRQDEKSFIDIDTYEDLTRTGDTE